MHTLKAYVDLTRIHFFFVLPLLFLSGLFLSFQTYGGFDCLVYTTSIILSYFL